MTKTENTAVNRLIEQAHSRSLDADDALFSSPPPKKHTLPRPFPNRIAPIEPPAPMPRHRVPSSTQTELHAAPPAPAHRPAELEDSGLLELDEVEDDDDVPVFVDEPAVRLADIKPVAARPSELGGMLPAVDEQAWYEESVGVDRLEVDRVDETQHGTRFVRRKSRATSVLLLGAAFATGLVATAVIAWPSRQASIAPVAPAAAPKTAEPAVQPAPAPVVVEAAPAPAAEPAIVEPVAAPEAAVVEPVAAPEAAVVEPVAAPETAIVEPIVPVIETPPAASARLAVELDSVPRGAAVLLVEAGTTVTLGATPLSHELDASRSYEIMFTLAGHKSALVTIDPNKSQRVNVDLASSTATASPRAEAAVAIVEPTPAPAPAVERRARPERKPAARPARPARVAKAEPAKKAPVSVGGKGGMLMIGSKPPCDIFVDGKPTRLKTPQRGLELAPGPHKITLVNREHKITETFTVNVKAGAPTKVVKDLTRRMK